MKGASTTVCWSGRQEAAATDGTHGDVLEAARTEHGTAGGITRWRGGGRARGEAPGRRLGEGEGGGKGKERGRKTVGRHKLSRQRLELVRRNRFSYVSLLRSGQYCNE
eukprot:1857548-Prymnesium_polylepis.1